VLGYRDFRFGGSWRGDHPHLIAWLDNFAARVPAFRRNQADGLKLHPPPPGGEKQANVPACDEHGLVRRSLPPSVLPGSACIRIVDHASSSNNEDDLLDHARRP